MTYQRVRVPVLEADVIIDCPKAKNHHVQPISGALKNWVGAVNAEWRQRNHGTHRRGCGAGPHGRAER